MSKTSTRPSNVIPIFYTVDDDYASLAIISISSIIANANPAYDYRIHVIHQGLSQANLDRFATLSRPHFKIILRELAEELNFIENRHGNRLNGSIFSLSIFFRLFIPDSFPEYDQGIYLDADTVVPGDISELFTTTLGDNFLAGAHDLSIAAIPDFIEYIEKGDGVPYKGYINSGVLLLNMAKLRAAHLRERFLDIFTKYHANTVAPDQDYLNTLCLGRIAYLDPAWNAMPAPNLDPMPEPKIVHYNLFFKPWHQACDYENYFWHYAQLAGLEEEFRIIRASRTAEDAAADQSALAAMLAQSQEVVASATGLAPVFQKEPRL